MMSSMHRKALYTHILVAVFCFSSALSYPGGPTFCITPHDHVGMSHPVNKSPCHETSSHDHYHQLNPHQLHDVDSTKQCCQTRSHHSDECRQSSIILNNQTDRTDATRSLTLSATSTIDSLQLSGWNLLLKIPKTNNPTSLSLRTVILIQ